MPPHTGNLRPAGGKRPTAEQLRRIRGILYACTAAFFIGAFVWGAALLQQGSVAPVASSVVRTQTVHQIAKTGNPMAQPRITPAASAANLQQAPEQTPEQTPGYTEDTLEDPADVIAECTLSIPSLSLELPVTAYCTDEALLSSVCKLTGPQPGGEGNYVIVGHNFINGAQFGKLNKLQKGARVVLTDQENQAYCYTVYAMELVTPEDMQALAVEPGSTEVTLLTCAEENTRRLLIRCWIE